VDEQSHPEEAVRARPPFDPEILAARLQDAVEAEPRHDEEPGHLRRRVGAALVLLFLIRDIATGPAHQLDGDRSSFGSGAAFATPSPKPSGHGARSRVAARKDRLDVWRTAGF
jgi:hypothetical protein